MGRGSSKRHKQKQIHQPATATQNASYTINDIENAYYNALIRKEQATERQTEEKRQQLLQKIGRKDYTHLRPFKAWWCELGNMFVQLWKMRELRKEDMYEHTFTQAMIKMVLSILLKACGLVTQVLGCLYISIGIVRLLNWQTWGLVISQNPLPPLTTWYYDIFVILFGIIVGIFAMFIKFTRWELEQSKDSNYLMGIISIVVSILLCLLFPS